MGDVVWLTAQKRPRPALWRECVGEVLREHRLDRRERLLDVAERARVAPQYLSEIERGRKDASSEVFQAVSRAVGLDPAEVARRAASRMTRGPVCLSALPVAA